MSAGFVFGTMITSVLRVKSTGFSTSPCVYSMFGIVVFADASTSAGAPFMICVASVLDPAKEYVSRESIAGNASVNDDAAKTVIGGGSGFPDGFGLAAPATPAPTTSSSAAARAAGGRRVTAAPSPTST